MKQEMFWKNNIKLLKLIKNIIIKIDIIWSNIKNFNSFKYFHEDSL